MARNTAKYHTKRKGKIVHRGITDNLKRRTSEHKRNYPGSTTSQVGRRTTREAALAWERAGGKR